ncbi:hypothetical protein FE257_001459 [Aspergillus nanangensis]|uniref:KN homeodomain domain-containing protein n=1 Tax=Aspergillus nanangensis TaxID=2582783 RepID=A0AAD4GPM0_ASPNN|nr:hypothetical protein FE257_001459 [Aspergillus nanangensis]
MAYISAERTQNYFRSGFEWIFAFLLVKSTTSSIRTAAKHRRTQFSKPAIDMLQNWLRDHADHPYPKENKKQALMRSTDLNHHQALSPWDADPSHTKAETGAPG